MKILLIVPAIAIIALLVRGVIPYIIYLISNLFSRKTSKKKVVFPISIKLLLIDVLAIGILTGFFVFILSFLDQFHTNKIYSFIIGALMVAIFPSYDFIIQPIVISLLNRKKSLKNYEDFLTTNNYPFKVYQLNLNLINIYATGVLNKY
jgi:hypothetical protein